MGTQSQKPSSPPGCQLTSQCAHEALGTQAWPLARHSLSAPWWQPPLSRDVGAFALWRAGCLLLVLPCSPATPTSPCHGARDTRRASSPFLSVKHRESCKQRTLTPG